MLSMNNTNWNNKYLKYIFAAMVVVGFGVVLVTARQKNTGSSSNLVTVASASEVHQECESSPQGSEITNCYEAKFKAHMEKNGARSTLVLLEDLEKLGGYAKTNCHPLSHIVGNIALHVYGSVPKAAPEYLPVCHSGYYHGLLEEYLGTAESYEIGIRQVCGKVEDGPYFNWFQCTHGLGHGVMQFRDNELPQALTDCDLVDPVNSAREICYAGAFMENITTDEKTGHPGKYIKKENPIYPCDWVETKYKSACYFLASSQILKINGWNMPEAMKICETRTEKDYRWLCFQSIGRDVAGSSLRNIEKVNELCMLAVKDYRGDCYFGAVRDFINEKGEFDTGIAMCSAAPLDYRQKCYDAVYLDLGLFKKGNDFMAICATMPEPYMGQCKSRVIY